MNTVSVPKYRLQVLLETAARQHGIIDARSHADAGGSGDFFPNPGIGDVVCDGWQVDPQLAIEVMVAYRGELHQESIRLRMTTPSFTAVLRGMKQAINPVGYPAVDVPALLLKLRDVAVAYGDVD